MIYNIMRISFLFLILFCQHILTLCQEGCLLCETKTEFSKCKICDMFSGYHLSKQTKSCKKLKNKNCEVHSMDLDLISCLQCKENYFLDHPSKSCQKIESSKKIKNCIYYHWDQKCLRCNFGFYLSKNVCIEIKNPIINCQIHDSPTFCSQCLDGFYFDKTLKICLEIEKIDNCKIYSMLECRECFSNFFYFENILNDESQVIKSLNFFSGNLNDISVVLDSKNNEMLKNCKKREIDFCDKYENPKKCLKCANNYRLNSEFNCIKSPNYSIDFCKVYDGPETCLECETSYYLFENNCLLMQENEKECDLSQYFISKINKECYKRSHKILNCSKYSIYSDSCEECLISFVLSKNKLMCLPHIPHCDEYNLDENSKANNIHSETLKCLKCSKHFYISVNFTECLPQIDHFCQKFVKNSSKCEKCIDNYFLSEQKIENSFCVKHEIKNCKKFEPLNDSCLECNDFYFIDENKNCLPYSHNNCKKFDERSDNCLECFQNYFMLNGICYMRTALNCKTNHSFDDKCEECYSDYFLDENSKNCLPILLKNCLVIDENVPHLCSKCNSDYYFDSISNQCIFNSSENCSLKSQNSNSCEKCKEYYFLNSKDSKCYPFTKKNCLTHSDSENKCIDCPENFYLSKSKDCLPIFNMNCQSFDSSTNMCLQCQHGYQIEKNNFCQKILITGCKIYSFTNCQICHEGFFLHSNKKSCLPLKMSFCSQFDEDYNCSECIKGFYLDDDLDCVPLLSENCAVPDFSKSNPNCKKCEFGFYLNESENSCNEQNIQNCSKFVENENKCSKCQIGFELSADGFTCSLSKQTDLKNCQIANSKDSSRCVLCYQYYFLNSEAQCELIQNIENCIEYFFNSNKCKSCLFMMKPSNDFSKCEKIILPENCLSYNPDSYKCSECGEKYYLNEDICILQSIKNCIKYISNKNICSECSSGYILQNNSCIQPNQLAINCNLAISAGNCLICKTGYYKTENNQCSLQNITGCLKYFPNQNFCEICSAKFIQKSGKCEINFDIIKNCQKKKENSLNECEICNKNFFLDDSKKCILRTKTSDSFKIDPFCAGNFTDTATECDFCGYENHSSILMSEYKYSRDLEGCSSFDGTSCSGCLPGYDNLDSSSTCSKFPDNQTPICFQMSSIITSTKTLSDPDECLKCMPGYFLNDSNICIEESSDDLNCKQYDSEGVCDECLPGFIQVSYPSEPIFECLGFENLEEIANCAVYSIDGLSCEICEYNYIKNNNICSPLYTSQYLPALSTNRIIEQIEEESNKKFLFQQEFNNSSFVSMGCDFGKLPVLSVLRQNFYKKAGFPIIQPNQNFQTFVSTKAEFFPSFFSAHSCQDAPIYENYILDENFTPYPIYTKTDLNESNYNSPCSNWLKDSGKLFCISCKDSLYPLYRSVYGSQDGTLFTFAAIDCVNVSESGFSLEKNFQGLDYQYEKSLSLSTFTNFDSCVDQTEAFVLFMGKDSSFIIPVQHQFEGNSHENIVCLKLDETYFDAVPDSDIYSSTNLPGGVSNCQINIKLITFNTNLTKFSSNQTANDTSVFKCAACLPGFSALKDYNDNHDEYIQDFANNEGLILNCSPIPNCNLNSSNNWMNACETCENGFLWEYDSDSDRILFHKCVAETSFTNCLTSDGSSCKICKIGFTLNNKGKCLSVASDISCTSAGLGTFDFPETDNQNIHNITFLQFLLAKNFPNSNKSYCGQCSSNKYLSLINDNSVSKCSSNVYFSENSEPNEIDNCIISSSNKCLLCKQSYIIVTGDSSIDDKGSCVLIDDSFAVIDNCFSIESTSITECLKCANGFQKVSTPSSELCVSSLIVPFRCNKFNETNNFCEICSRGYKIDETNFINCLQISENDECNQATFDGRCLQCVKHTSKIPYHTKLQSPIGRKNYSFECIEIFDISTVLPFIGLTFGFDQNTQSNFVENSSKPIDFYVASKNNLTENISELNHSVIDVCVVNVEPVSSGDNQTDSVENCVEYNHLNECIFCGSNHFYDSNSKSCIVLPIINFCLMRAADINVCLLCQQNYFWDGENCVAHSSNVKLNCLVLDPYSNGCLKCFPQHKLYSHSIRTCIKNKRIPFCSFQDEDGSCQICDKGYQLYPPIGFQNIIVKRKCKVSPNIPYCFKMNSFDNEKCEKCFSGFELYNNKCQIVKSKNIFACIKYDFSGSFCVDCLFPFKLIQGKCYKKNLENCFEAHPKFLSICLNCKTNFFNRNGKCVLREYLNCKIFSQNEDNCISCSANYYLQQKKCHKYSINNCKIFHPNENSCLTCKNKHFYDKRSKSCLESYLQNCKIISTESFNKCSLCKNKHYLNTNRTCTPISDLNCEKNDPFADICLKCKPGFYLSLEKMKCFIFTAQNCQFAYTHKNECLTCQKGFVLRNKTCIFEEQDKNCLSFVDGKCLKCNSQSYMKNNRCILYSAKNCLVFSKSENKCLSCISNFFMSDNGICMRNTLKNCRKILSSSNDCFECEKGFYKENGQCKLNSAKNCLKKSKNNNVCEKCNKNSFFEKRNQTCQEYSFSVRNGCRSFHPHLNMCLFCKEGFYLDKKNSLCIAQYIKFCDKYHISQNICLSCVKNFYLYENKCFEYSIKSCEIFHPKKDACLVCKKGFYLGPKSSCLKYSILNCSVFSQVSDICLKCKNDNFYIDKRGNCNSYSLKNCEIKDSFRNSCLKCKTNFYLQKNILNEFECQKLSKVLNCQEYSTISNSCILCSDSHFLDKNLNFCFPKSEIINYCKEYHSETKCSVCKPPFYPQRNRCEKSKKIISNCIEYKFDGFCLKCENNFLLNEKSSECLKIKETSCLTFRDSLNCQTCPEGSILKYLNPLDANLTSDETKYSVKQVCQKLDISNCIEAKEENLNIICLKCKTDYYLESSSRCVEVSNKIDGCQFYFADGICSKCFQNRELSSNKKHCVLNLEINQKLKCKKIEFLSKPKCYICNFGYFLNVQGKCESCERKGCAICSTSECFLCLPGYYMNHQSECIRQNLSEDRNFKLSLDFGTNSNSSINIKEKFLLIYSVIIFYSLI